jgi:hypothetical protein
MITPLCFAKKYPDIFHSSSGEAHARSNSRKTWGTNMVTSSREIFLPEKRSVSFGAFHQEVRHNYPCRLLNRIQTGFVNKCQSELKRSWESILNGEERMISRWKSTYRHEATFHFLQLPRTRLQPPFWPKLVRVFTKDISVMVNNPRVHTDDSACRNIDTTERSSSFRNHTLERIPNSWMQSQ